VGVRGGVRGALQTGENVEHLDDDFAQDAEDAAWIPSIGARGWIVLTKDAALRRNPLEVQAMLAAKTAVYIFGNASVKGDQVARAFQIALPRIRTATRRFKVPLIGRVNVAGELNVVFAEGWS
jgi:hypothetical protein